MRNTLPLLSRVQASAPMTATATPPQPVPTIRLISATPSATGSATDHSTSFSSVAPFASSPLAPRTESEAPRKRLVPKRSKLALLGGGKSKDKGGNKDFSDVVRRVGATGSASAGRGGFEIYVDHADDPELGEIVVVKKKKSRMGLDGMRWGALGEVTNVPTTTTKERSAPVENLLKVKGDESQKWWSIGRGRKDSKEKGKEKERDQPSVRSKTPEPSKPMDSRARFNSLDSGILLTDPKPHHNDTVCSVQTLLPTEVEAPNGLLAPPSTNAGTNSGSIAIRAMRSMRSLARMKSWATLSSATSIEKEGNAASTNMNMTTINGTMTKKEKEKGERKKKKKVKEVEKEKVKEKKKTVRYSGSSFEAGALSTQGSPLPAKKEETVKAAKKKQSMLGLGLPSTMRLTTVRNVSTSSSASSTGPPPSAMNRLSVDSAHLIMNANGRPSSVLSSGSSLRPPSTASGVSAFSGRSARSSSSSVVSVRWDEEGLQSVKEMQRKERRSKRESAASSGMAKTTRDRESRRKSEARRRTPISEIFPETQSQRPSSMSPPASVFERPIVMVEEATVDGHSAPADEPADEVSLETPVKRARPRPMSEQMLGKMRPQGMYDDADGVMSILDAATNDLASLINRLDLEATPASSNGSPMKRSPFTLMGSPSRANLPGDDSPIKKRTMGKDSPLVSELRQSMASISSLRLYARAQAKVDGPVPATRQQGFKSSTLIGQQIAPWSALDWQVSPKKPVTKNAATVRPTHKRTMTPLPAMEPPPVFQPLRPAKTKVSPVISTALSSPSFTTPPVNDPCEPSSKTFGSRPSKMGLRPSVDDIDEAAPSPTPVFKRASGHIRSGSVLSTMGRKASRFSLGSSTTDTGIPMSPEARKGLGLAGTMGDSGSTEPPIDPEDPDSDIPDELQVILSGQSDEECTRSFDDTLSFHRTSTPSSPINAPLVLPLSVEHQPIMEDEVDIPMFRAQLIDEEANHADIDEGENGSCSEDDTKKSFDFTGELKILNESGASDRRSFVEQLENAFRTPARIELGLDDGFLKVDVPPVPMLPPAHRPTPPEDVAPRSVSNPEISSTLDSTLEDEPYRNSAVSDTLDHLLAECDEDLCRPYPEMRRSNGSMRSKASDGHLNVDFKFGGKPFIPDAVPEKEEERPLTLSDIIPPLSHTITHSRSQSLSSIVEEDSSVLKSIMAKASELQISASRRRVDSDSSSKRRGRVMSLISHPSTHSRNTSEASFTGFESFEEVRRGFEFGRDRPAFYPPPGATSRPSHNRHESFYSIASVSSYGAVVDSGAPDPFGYGPSRPPSEDLSLSMSMSVDDTFSFIRKDLRRQRVDSDASSFYFKAPGSSQVGNLSRRGHRRHESTLSVASNAPPVSIYNRSFGAHRRSNSNASNTSASSVAQSYAMYGASGGRAIWARHRQDLSVDSMSSDFSAMRLGRPGLGDKMFDMDHGMPLSAISASPPESVAGEQLNDRTTYDSLFDGTRRLSADDSLFEKTGYRSSSYSSDGSVFGYGDSHPEEGNGGQPAGQFRPLSMMSIASVHTAEKEDDTMITMIGGGHVRRRSIDSLIEGSPCIKMGIERRKQHLYEQGRVLRFDQFDDNNVDTENSIHSNKSRLLEKPSIASTSSHQFGDERMIMARKGLLERQSLEDSALIAHGEDLLASLRSQPIFSRPGPASRSRSSTVTSCSGGETPPLSSSDGSSISDGSQSSIDISHLNALLANFSHPSSGTARARARARARGTGHRRRISQARASRSSVYETIQEESMILSSSPSPAKVSAPPSAAKAASPMPVNDSVYIVDSDAQSLSEDWDDDRGIVGMRRYYALRDEAHETVTESKRIWIDTPFSVFAVQSFQPPVNRHGMQALLEHSQSNYGPLPSELRSRRIRSRTSSRASPYPARSLKSSFSPEQSRPAFIDVNERSFNISKSLMHQQPTPALQEVSANPNIAVISPPPAIEFKPFTPFAVELEKSSQQINKNGLGLPVPPRPRVTSSARRTALGWSKRSKGKSSSSDHKENISQGMLITPSETLRLSRPRPRGRPTPARVPVPRA